MNDTELLIVAKTIRNKRKIARVKKTQLVIAENDLAEAESRLQEED